MTAPVSLTALVKMWLSSSSAELQEATAPGLIELFGRHNPWRAGPGEDMAAADALWLALCTPGSLDDKAWSTLLTACLKHPQAPPPSEWSSRRTPAIYTPRQHRYPAPDPLPLPWSHAAAALGSVSALNAFVKCGGLVGGKDELGRPALAYVNWVDEESAIMIESLFAAAQKENADMSSGPWIMTWKKECGLSSTELSQAQREVQKNVQKFPISNRQATTTDAAWSEMLELLEMLPGQRACSTLAQRLSIDKILAADPPKRLEWAETVTCALIPQLARSRWISSSKQSAWFSTFRWALGLLKPYEADPTVSNRIATAHAALHLVYSSTSDIKNLPDGLQKDITEFAATQTPAQWRNHGIKLLQEPEFSPISSEITLHEHLSKSLWRSTTTWSDIASLPLSVWRVWMAADTSLKSVYETLQKAKKSDVARSPEDDTTLLLAATHWAANHVSAPSEPWTVKDNPVWQGLKSLLLGDKSRFPSDTAIWSAVLDRSSATPPPLPACEAMLDMLTQATKDKSPEHITALRSLVSNWSLSQQIAPTDASVSTKRRM